MDSSRRGAVLTGLLPGVLPARGQDDEGRALSRSVGGSRGAEAGALDPPAEKPIVNRA